MPPSSFKKVEFTSEGGVIRGRLYLTSAQKTNPCIIMAHGTSATITMALDRYAEEFQKSGFNVLLYDHLGFGESGGKLRQTINPWVQGRGFRDAVEFVRAMEDVHNGQIILWGDSFSGALVLTVGALIEDLSAIVAYCPPCGPIALEISDLEKTFFQLKNIFINTDISKIKEGTIEGPMPVVSSEQNGTPSLLGPIQAFKWFIDQGGKYGSGWENIVTRVIPKTEVPFSPQVTASFISCPTLMVVGRNDEMPHIMPSIQRHVFDCLTCSKEFYDIDGGHFGALWPDTDLFREALELELKFLKAVL